MVVMACCMPLMLCAEVWEHAMLYPSVDQYGDNITLSGKVCVPLDKQPKGIILIPHYTITANEQAPSIHVTADAPYFWEDFVLLMPDYIGYGVTSDRVHPYLAGELTARNGIDMVFAAQPLLDSLDLKIPLDSLYIFGYSQGGASAVWTMRVIEEQYADRLHLKGCYAGGGPYDVAWTYDDAVATGRVTLPAAIAMLVMGTDAAYDLHLNRADFFTRSMEKKYMKYIASKKYDGLTIYFKMPNHRLKHWLTAVGRDKTQPQTKRLYEGLQRSSIVTADSCPSWTPQAPLYVFHSNKDNIVPVQCAEQLQRCYPDLPNVTYDIGNYGNHIQASAEFRKRVREMLNAL